MYVCVCCYTCCCCYCTHYAVVIVLFLVLLLVLNFFLNNRFMLLLLLLLAFLLVLILRCKYRCYCLSTTAYSQISCAAFAIFLHPSSGCICYCCFCCCCNFIVYLLYAYYVVIVAAVVHQLFCSPKAACVATLLALSENQPQGSHSTTLLSSSLCVSWKLQEICWGQWHIYKTKNVCFSKIKSKFPLK